MNEYDEMIVKTFLEQQGKLFSESVAATPEEAVIFLEDCMAVVCKNIGEVRSYFEEVADVEGMTDRELMEADEVFVIPDGRFLVVEG